MEELFNRRSNKRHDLKKYLPKNLPYLIHVAGTNGKGSVCSYLESVLMQKYRVGKFSSPHLLNVEERITINQEQIPHEILLNEYEKLKNLDLGFFEFLFIIAMNYFSTQNVDIAIIEVGIGGRFDCTNQIQYDIALITNVGMDHTEILGNSLYSISYQKAGIAKNNTKTFYTDLILKKYIENETNNSKFVKEITKFKLPLFGDFQRKNFALAYEVFKIFKFSDAQIQNGLKNLKIMGRQQLINENTLIDVSHNVDSIKGLIQTLDNMKIGKNIKIHLSCLMDKDLKSIYRLFINKNYDVTIYPMPNIKRGRSVENIIETLGENVKIATTFSNDNRYFNIYCGSFYFIQKVLIYLNKKA